MDDKITSYQDIANEIGALVAAKNEAYGNSFERSGEILSVLFPNGVTPDRYTDLLCIVRVLDKLFRVAASPIDPMGESPWRDVAGYGILGAANTDRPSSFIPIPHSPPPPPDLGEASVADTLPSGPGDDPLPRDEVGVKMMGSYTVYATHPDSPHLRSRQYADAVEAYQSFWQSRQTGWRVSIHRPDGTLLDTRVCT